MDLKYITICDATSLKVSVEMREIQARMRRSVGYTLLSQKIFHETALNFAEQFSPEELVREVSQALIAEQKIP